MESTNDFDGENVISIDSTELSVEHGNSVSTKQFEKALATIDIAAARMPSSYKQAKIALASCANIDECQDWANKAEALASYAKMAGDDSLRTMADRIQARAVRRMGELYKTFNAQGQRTDQLKEGALQKLTQKEVAKSAGISEHQAKQAVRVANVPEEKFEAAIEAPKPATVTALAETGKRVRTVRTEGFKRVSHLIGTVKRGQCRAREAKHEADYCRRDSQTNTQAVSKS
jgi:hypothetical protein